MGLELGEPILKETDQNIRERKTTWDIKNVVAKSSVETPNGTLDLLKIYEKSGNAKYNPKRFPGLILKQESPKITTLMFTTGKIILTGAKTIEMIEKSLNRILQMLEKMGIKIMNKPEASLVNIVVSGDFYQWLSLDEMLLFLEGAIYEPVTFPGLIYTLKDPRATFLLFNSGKFVCTGANKVEDIKTAIKYMEKELKSFNLM